MHTLLLIVLTILGLAGVFIVIPSLLRTCLLKRRKSKMIVLRGVDGEETNIFSNNGLCEISQ